MKTWHSHWAWTKERGATWLLCWAAGWRLCYSGELPRPACLKHPIDTTPCQNKVSGRIARAQASRNPVIGPTQAPPIHCRNNESQKQNIIKIIQRFSPTTSLPLSLSHSHSSANSLTKAPHRVQPFTTEPKICVHSSVAPWNESMTTVIVLGVAATRWSQIRVFVDLRTHSLTVAGR